jgi:uncharacterized delta-60 repeat protein
VRTPTIIWLCLLVVIPCRVEGTCEPNIPADLTRDCRVNLDDFALFAPDWARPALSHQWVAAYNGPANDFDRAYTIATDSAGNVYVAGRAGLSATTCDYVTIKYSQDGSELWAATYNGPANDKDEAKALSIDASGNIYVTGYSDGLGTAYDCATIKYSTDGNEIWAARYNGTGNGGDIGSDIAIDSSGNICVTGSAAGSGTGYDCITIKYSADGNQLWAATYNGPQNSTDEARAIIIADSNDVYVAGYSLGSVADIDYITIKYSPEGNELWTARYEGPASSTDLAEAIAVDSSGNVYVTGYSAGASTGYDYATIKYSSDGNELWAVRYNGPENGSDKAKAIAIDAADNLYVTGYCASAQTGYDWVTIKYSPDGGELWKARYNSPQNGSDEAWAIAIDGNNGVYVTGSSTGTGTGEDCTTIKYSADGSVLWVAAYNGTANAADKAQAIAISSSGNIYVTGYTTGAASDSDFITIKYLPDYSCAPPLTADLTHNCEVDIFDLAEFCRYWLDCNLDPPESCP